MLQRILKLAQTFMEYSKRNGLGKTIQFMLAKVLYHLTTNREILRWQSNRPPIVKNRLVFYSSVDYSDNARILSDYMVEHGYLKNHEIIWLVSDPSRFKHLEQKNLRFVLEKHPESGLRTMESYQYALTAEKIFFTHSMRWLKESERLPEQHFINLWHGCGYKSAKGNSELIYFDSVLVPGEVFVETKTEFFRCRSEQILPLGYPRYDLMLSYTERGREFMDTFRTSPADKLILWMPTYRISNSPALSENTLTNQLNLPVMGTIEDLADLNEECSRQGVVLILKRHYLQMKYGVDQKFSHVRYLDDLDLENAGVQLYEAISWADALITDYSSIAIDYLLMDKPLAFTLDDYEGYRDSRGFVFEDPLQYMPGMHIYNKAEFLEFMGRISREEDSWKEDRLRVRKSTHNTPEGESYCSRICRELKL